MKIILLFILLLASLNSFSQDTIIMTNGELIKSKVLEISINEIKYRLHDDPGGPVIVVEREKIKSLTVSGQKIIDSKNSAKEDVIVKLDGGTLKVKIIEVGTEQVKFKLYNNPDGPVISLKKSEIKKIIVDGSVVYEHKVDPYSTSNALILDKNSSLKFHFFSPIYRHIAFTYEWMNKPGFNWELGMGVIGPGVSRNSNIFPSRNPQGVFLRFGPKFLVGTTSDIEIEGARLSHPLKGRYLKIEMILHSMSTTHRIDTGSYPFMGTANFKRKYQSVSLEMIYGRQFILGNSITCAWYFGGGYSFENTEDIGRPRNAIYWWNDYDPRRYSHIFLGKNFPVILTAGITVGYILKTPDFLNRPSSAERASAREEYPVNKK